MVLIATWNVNSIKQREAACAAWLKRVGPDILCLQELKCQTEAFPRQTFEDLGYNCEVIGQKSFNGVAILSKFPVDEVITELPGGDGDDHARYIEAVISVPGKGALRVASIYAPNGNPVDTPKFGFKLSWLARFKTHVEGLLSLEEALVLAGDYNIIPRAEDVYDATKWVDDALFRLEARKAFRRVMNLGLTDALTACDSKGGQFTFWDYQAGAWQRNLGLRIDHILLSPGAAKKLSAAGVDKSPRGGDKPSDHTPVWARLSLN